jgi:hypothetical protein
VFAQGTTQLITAQLIQTLARHYDYIQTLEFNKVVAEVITHYPLNLITINRSTHMLLGDR